MPSIDVDQDLIDAAGAGDAGKARDLLASGADPRSLESLALSVAAKYGHVDCVKLLLKVSDPKSGDCHALRWAARYGHAECLRLLLPVSDPKVNESYALRLAARNGHAECVRLLLSMSGAKRDESAALRCAAENGHVECVRALRAASLPLIEIDGLLGEVLASGQAKVAAMLIAEEPRLLDGVDLSRCHAEALESGHGGLASYLSSIMDQRELVGVAPDAASCGGRGLARL